MSWRTEGHYLGLGAEESEWLRRFDREWDKKESGRSRTDALDFAGRRFDLLARIAEELGSDTLRVELEATLIMIAAQIARFTVPRQTKAGWSIHLVTKCGKRVRAHFGDLGEATQAYEAMEELLQWFPRG